jgi:hypothetical protein
MSDSRPLKRPRFVPDKADQDAVKKLMQEQEPPSRQISDKDRVLRGIKPGVSPLCDSPSEREMLQTQGTFTQNFKPFLDSIVSERIKQARDNLKRMTGQGGASAASAAGLGPVAGLNRPAVSGAGSSKPDFSVSCC